MRSCALEGPRVMNRGQGLLGLGCLWTGPGGEPWVIFVLPWVLIRDSRQRLCSTPSSPAGIPWGPSAPSPAPTLLLSPTDRISIRSYRTDISMSDFENSRDFEGRDNMGASPEAQETSLGGKDGTSLPGGLPRPRGTSMSPDSASGVGMGGQGGLIPPLLLFTQSLPPLPRTPWRAKNPRRRRG